MRGGGWRATRAAACDEAWLAAARGGAGRAVYGRHGACRSRGRPRRDKAAGIGETREREPVVAWLASPVAACGVCVLCLGGGGGR